MKKQLLLLLAGALLTGTAATAQTADEIIKKHIDAVGGDAAWKKVNSVRMTGSVNAQGMDIPVIVTKVKDKGIRTDMEVMGTKGFVIITPTAGWQFTPFGNGQTKPEPATPEIVKAQQDQLLIGDALYDYAARGSKVEYVGKDDVEGTECLKLRLTSKDGNVSTIFIDPATYYIIKEVAKVKADGKEQEVSSTKGNYQKLPEGIVVPMTMGGPMGDVKLTKVEVNTIKDDSIFKPEVGKGG